jgi:Arc/MetJ-type ribon-helix-helix transcriptional regulator
MTIILSREVGKLVNARVKRGEYESPDALVAAAVTAPH